jgi:lambda family phage portal protein
MGVVDWIARRNGYVKPSETKMARRQFTGAQVNRLTASWNTQPKPIDVDIRAGLRKLRARTREQAQNNDYVRRFLNLTKSNVIGSQGIQLQARSVDPSGKPDTLANSAIEESWKDWGAQGSPDVTACHSWRSIQRLVIETVAKDGEALLIKHKNWSGNAARFALEFIDVEALDVDHSRELKNGNVVQMGVELNRWRRPVAYHLLTTSNTADDYTYKGRKYRRVSADKVLHLFLPESVWQTRGFPWLASSLLRLNMLNGYEEAELIAARVASTKMGFFESEGGEEYSGDDNDLDGNVITDAEPGSFEMLPAGMKFSSWEPSHPNAAFSEFVKANLRGIAAGLGVSYHTLANDLEGVNYSSGRLGALEDREAWKGLQDWMIESFCIPVYREWLTTSLLAGSITVAGRPLKAARYEKFKRVSWQPRRWPWVDPQKDMNANIQAIEQRIRSVSDVIREQGRDPDEVWQEIARERERMKELGIETEPANAGFFSNGENEDDEKENEDSDKDKDDKS